MDWDKWEAKRLKALNYETDLENVPMVNLLLVGIVGSGKSSFFNTIASIFKEQIAGAQETWSDGTDEISITKHFLIKNPGGRRCKKAGFNLCDTMGMEEVDGLALDDLVYVLDGNVPDGFHFKDKERITPKSRGFIRDPTLKERMHCLAYVVNGAKVFLNHEEIKQKFKQLRALASARGIRVVILVTHIDEVCEEVKTNVRNAHKSVAVKKVVDKISGVTGIPVSYILLVKNYSSEVEIDGNINALNLTALQKMLDYADDILDNFDQ